MGYSMEQSNIEEKEHDMDNIAGLMSLLQANKGMDLPGILALAKDKGYEGGFGGQNGMWIIVLLILFMGMNGGGLFGANRAAAADVVGTQNLEIITSLYDRLAANNATVTQGFSTLDTSLCSSIAAVISNINAQGDRSYDATRNVGDAVRECCCQMSAAMASIECQLGGVRQAIDNTNTNLTNRIALSEERNAVQFERTNNNIIQSEQRLACLIKDQAKDAEIARLTRENCALSSSLQNERLGDHVVNTLEKFMVHHYAPNTCSTSSASIGGSK